jgi:lactoylglutathione lyase
MVPTMRTLHVGLRVSNLEPSLAFYCAVGYTVVGTVEGTPLGSLTMLQLPGDAFATIELVHDTAKGTVDLGSGLNGRPAIPTASPEPHSVLPA